MSKQWKKEQSSRCCTADVFLSQPLNQLYNNQKIDKLVLFSTSCQLSVSNKPCPPPHVAVDDIDGVVIVVGEGDGLGRHDVGAVVQLPVQNLGSLLHLFSFLDLALFTGLIFKLLNKYRNAFCTDSS